jgi:putative phosphoribosyl transferase
MFENRKSAGRALARRLEHMRGEEPVVLALPRGGVPVGFEVATALGAPLDLVLVRKIGVPWQPELALGAVVDGADPQLVYDYRLAAELNVPADYLEQERARQLAEIERRRKLYFGDRPPVPVRGRTVIVVDDGIATGSTVRAALRALRKAGVARLVLAVPVGPPDTIELLSNEVDGIVCLETPSPFFAIGEHYADFRQTSDDEVIALLQRAASRDDAASPPRNA